MSSGSVGLSCSAVSSLIRRLAGHADKVESITEFCDIVACVGCLASAASCTAADTVVSHGTRDTQERASSLETVEKIYQSIADLLDSSLHEHVVQQVGYSSWCVRSHECCSAASRK